MSDCIKILSTAVRLYWVLTLLALLLVSCSSSTPPTAAGGGGETPTASVYAGVAECYFCHYPDDAITRFSGMDIVEKWRNGPHGNNESITVAHVRYDDHPNNTGFPYYDYSGLGTDPNCTTDCHDQLGDGELLEDAGIAYIGLVNRPIVGCESCHGEGAEHAATVALVSPEYPSPDYDRCGQCHFSDFDHNKHHPEGDNIYEDYVSSPHFGSLEDPNYVVYGNPASGVKALCAKCHTDEGAWLYKDVSGGHDALEAALDGLDPVTDASVVQCRTCHNPHNPEELLLEATPGELSAEYRTCTSCHQATQQPTGDFGLADGFHGENSSYSWDAGLFDPSEIIYDTHFDDPSTTDAIEGYNLGPITDGLFGRESERVCRDCHNVHAATTAINTEWARSGHSGHIAEAKEDADASDPLNILNAAVQDSVDHNSPWAHYDWDNTNNVSMFGPSMDECQRCHTATGAKNYLDAWVTLNDDDLGNDEIYTPLKNDFSHLEGWTWNSPDTKDDGNATRSGQNELLYCWACHTDNAGGLRDPGPLSTEYGIDLNDMAGSNICIACHSGRVSGDQIKDLNEPDFDDVGFLNSHYLAAGGILFKVIGYEFDTLNYDNSAFYNHDNPTELDDNGPCIGCHMITDESHLFLPVEEDVTGEITALTSYDQTCDSCHYSAGATTLMAQMNDLKTGYEAALDALKAELDSHELFFAPEYPYFFQDSIDNGVLDDAEIDRSNAITDWDIYDDGNGKNYMGAAFNYNLLYHEPGAYVHNLQYTRKLIYDSIDFLDGGGLDMSVEATLGAGDAYDFLAGARP